MNSRSYQKYIQARDRLNSWALDIEAHQTVINTIKKLPRTSATIRRLLVDSRRRLKNAKRNQQRAEMAVIRAWDKI